VGVLRHGFLDLSFRAFDVVGLALAQITLSGGADNKKSLIVIYQFYVVC
jgi:hypothetical protein